MKVDGFQVEIVDGQITVTRPATNDTIAYRKSADAPHLELAHSWIALGVTTPEISEFRTQAFQVAVDKARETRLDCLLDPFGGFALSRPIASDCGSF